MGQHDAATEPLAELAGKPVILVVEDELLEHAVFRRKHSLHC